MKYLICFLFISCFSIAFTQSVKSPNLIPNSSFEQLSGPLIGWFYKGQHFTDAMKYWSSPTAASPDIYGPKARVPEQWQEKGFGKQPSHTGEYMAGITVYGCKDGKPHCREYLQIQLREALVPGQYYELVFYAAILPQSLPINKLGAVFTKSEVKEIIDEVLALPPTFSSNKIINPGKGEWVLFKESFIAEEPHDHLIIGNFFDDQSTQTAYSTSVQLPFAYYYIDDVSLRKLPPILPVPLDKDDLSLIDPLPGEVIRLKNIFFETDKAELLPRSFVELNKLHNLLLKYPHMIIEIRGHTDERGGDDYNQDLSIRRAKAVVDFLYEKGINLQRIQYKGFGYRHPIAPNDTKEGRQLNRRVEFAVLQK